MSKLKVNTDLFHIFYEIEKEGKTFLHKVYIQKENRPFLLSIFSKNNAINLAENPFCEVERIK